MPPTDTSEKGLESLIIQYLVSEAGYQQGHSNDYDPEHALDLVKLGEFIKATQPDVYEAVSLGTDSPKRTQFLHRLQGEIAKRGVIDVLRTGIKHGPLSVIMLFYGTPSAGNPKAQEQYKANIFSITRQLHFSKDETMLSLDMALFINGLPVATFELKNNLTKQNYWDAIEQYQNDRNPQELLFQKFRCAVHFALDDQQVWMCTELKGKASWFLPLNKGFNDAAGNPPNPNGLKTDYLWKEILTKDSLTNILENYAQVVEKEDPKTKKKKKTQIFPRYHQLDVVRQLLTKVQEEGAGHRYLIQHSAGSGKSNSITWLAHQLIEVEQNGQKAFDSVIVVTDRRILDKQIKDNIKQFAQVASTVGHSQHSSDLRDYLKSGKKIIITTVQKFPFVVDAIGNEHRDRKYAIIIDEAHSSQSGRTAAKMNMTLSAEGTEAEEEEPEDIINRYMEARKVASNASYFAFTATPKNKTLEVFGMPYNEGDKVKHRPFHSYTMKQAIQEGFILDVLEHYTPVQSYYRLIQTVENDPEFDTKKAKKKLRRYVESHDYAIEQKAEIMVDHFLEEVIAPQKIGGKARAMVVTGNIQRALQYYFAFKKYLEEIKSPYKAIVAFSGEPEFKGEKVTEAGLNGFPSKDIPDRIQEEPYRFLIVADKFQTGYDEPLLHTMYVDKPLEGIKAVQTLSRLNRAYPKKHDTFVLDFLNNVETIEAAFSDYYRTTILSEETDPNRLHDLKAELDGYQVYRWEQVEQFVQLYLTGASREQLDPILDVCVGHYLELDEDGQVDFKAKAKGFNRMYGFLASILPFSNAEWEKFSIFLHFLIPKLPAPKEEDLSRGVLEAIDMDSYRVEKQAEMAIVLADQDAEVDPVPTAVGGSKPEPELDYLSNIIREFNDLFGNIGWTDEDKIRQVIAEELPARVMADKAYQNAKKNSDEQNARIEHDRALEKVLIGLLSDHTELYKQFSDNPTFKKWLSKRIFDVTYGSDIA